MNNYLKKFNKEDLSQSELILYLHASAAFQLLYAGIELCLFELLHIKDHLTLSDIIRTVGLNKQSIRSLVFGLTSLRLIDKMNETFQNSDVIEKLFIKKEWDLFKKMVLLQANVMYTGQADFVESLKQNRNVGLQKFHGMGETIYQKLDQNPKLCKIFFDYMEAYSDFANPHLITNIDFSEDKSILDVGGGGGSNAIAIARQNNNLLVTILDLPIVASIANEKIEKNKLSKRIKFYSADMFTDKFPRNQDCVLFIHQLVIWSLEKNKVLLRKAYKSLNDNGRVIIFSSIAENSEDGPLMAALDTVYFRTIASGEGMIYPWKDYDKLLLQVGFKKIEHIKCNAWTPHGIIIGYK